MAFGDVRPTFGATKQAEFLLQCAERMGPNAQFQGVLKHRGITTNSILGVLAHLQLGRARLIAGYKNSARAAYQDFFAIWKDADPDIPILKEAKAEYAKLQ